ncbi:MAG: hypothetical protein DRQ47_02405, partial [Gammaproteobacteria bacterium]
MSLKNSSEKYGSLTIVLHWLMALIIVTLIIVGFSMAAMPDGDDKWAIYATHKAVGLVALLLALFRWYWTLTNEKPKPLSNWSQSDISIGNGVKWLLMIMMLLMPVAGVIMSLAGGHDISFFGLFTIEAMAEKNKMVAGIFHEIHEIGAWVI